MSHNAFLDFDKGWKETSFNHEQQFLTNDLDKYYSAVLEQFIKRKGWIQLTDELFDVKEHLVRSSMPTKSILSKGQR